MPEFEMPKSYDDIVPAKVAETGIYRGTLTKVRLEDNAARTGKNIVCDFALSGEAAVEGIVVSLFLSMPNPSDEGNLTRQGQPMADWKMENIARSIEPLGGTVKGRKVKLPDTAVCRVPVEKIVEEGRSYNRINGPLQPLKKAAPSGPKL